MRATRFNHVSIYADDLEASARFYEDLFGLERLPTPDFGATEVLWLRVGEQQLHLFRRETEAPVFHHFGIDVDDFERAYLEAQRRGLLDDSTFGPAVRELPDGSVQMYLRDPAGNLVEVDWPSAASLDRSVVGEIPRLEDDVRQRGDAARATLYHGRR
jgi:lactoylglutathione lyase